MGRKKKKSEDGAGQPDKETAGSANIEIGGLEALNERRMDSGNTSTRQNESIGIDRINKEQCDGKQNVERKSLKDHQRRLFGRRRSPSKSPTRRDSRKQRVQETGEKSELEGQGKNPSSSERMSRKDMFYSDTSKTRIRESNSEKGDEAQAPATIDSSDEEIRGGKIGRERKSRRDFVNSTKCRRRLLSKSPLREAKRCPLSSCFEKEKSGKKTDTPVEFEILYQNDTAIQQTKDDQSGSEAELKSEDNSNCRYMKYRNVVKKQQKRREHKAKGTKDERSMNRKPQRQKNTRGKKIALKCCGRNRKGQSNDSQGSDSNDDDTPPDCDPFDHKLTSPNELNTVTLKSKSKHVNLSKGMSLDISVDDTVKLNPFPEEPALEDTETCRSDLGNSGDGTFKSVKLNPYTDKPTLEDEENDSSVLVTCGEDIIKSAELNLFNKESGISSPATCGDCTAIIAQQKESTSDETKTLVIDQPEGEMEAIFDPSKTADLIKPVDQTECDSNQIDTVYRDNTEKQIDIVSNDIKIVEHARSGKQIGNISNKTQSKDDGEPLEDKADDSNRTEPDNNNTPRIQPEDNSYRTKTATDNDPGKPSEVNSGSTKTVGDGEQLDQNAANSDNEECEKNDKPRQQNYSIADTAYNDRPGDDSHDYQEHLNPFADDEKFESEYEISEQQQQLDRVEPRTEEVIVLGSKSPTVLVENSTDETVQNSKVRSTWSKLRRKRYRLSKNKKRSIAEVAKRSKLVNKGSSSGQDTDKTSGKNAKLSRKWRMYWANLKVRRHTKCKKSEKVNTKSKVNSDKDTQVSSVKLLTTSNADGIPAGTEKRIKTWRTRLYVRKRNCSANKDKKATENETDSADLVSISKTAKKRRWFKVRGPPKGRLDKHNQMDKRQSNSGDQVSKLKTERKGHGFKLRRKQRTLRQNTNAVLEWNESEIIRDDEVDVKSNNSTKCRRGLLSKSPLRLAKRCPLSSCFEKEKSGKKTDTPVEFEILHQNDSAIQQTTDDQSGSEAELKSADNSNCRYMKDRNVVKRQEKRRVHKAKGTKDERSMSGKPQRKNKARSKKIALKCCGKKRKGQSNNSQGSDSNDDDNPPDRDHFDHKPTSPNELKTVTLKSKCKHVKKGKSLDISVDDTVGLNPFAEEPALEDTETCRSDLGNSGEVTFKSEKLNPYTDKPTLEDEENDSSVLVTYGDDIIKSAELNLFNKESGKITPTTCGDCMAIITQQKESTSDETKTLVIDQPEGEMEGIFDPSKTADLIKPVDQTEYDSNQIDTVYRDNTEKQIDTVSNDIKIVEHAGPRKQIGNISDKTQSVDDGEPLEDKADDSNRTETDDNNTPRNQPEDNSYRTKTATDNDPGKPSEVNSGSTKTVGDGEQLDQNAANSDNEECEKNDKPRQQNYSFADTAYNDRPGDDSHEDYPEHLNPFADDEKTESEFDISEQQQQFDWVDTHTEEVIALESKSPTVLIENSTDETVQNSKVRSRWSKLRGKRYRLPNKKKSSITEAAKRSKLVNKGSSSGQDTDKTSGKNAKLSRKWRMYWAKLKVRRHKKCKKSEKVSTKSKDNSDNDAQVSSVKLLTTSKADRIPVGTGKRIQTWRARLYVRKRNCSANRDKKATENETDSADLVSISKTAKKPRWFKARGSPKCRFDKHNQMDKRLSNSGDQLSKLKPERKGHGFKLRRKPKKLRQHTNAVLERNESEIIGDDDDEMENHQEFNPLKGQIQSSLKDRPVPTSQHVGISDIITTHRRWWKFDKRQRSRDTGKSEPVKDRLVEDTEGENETNSPKKKRSLLKRFKKALKQKSKPSSESIEVICESTQDNIKKSSAEIKDDLKVKSDKMVGAGLKDSGKSKLTSTMAKLKKGWMKFNQRLVQ